MIPQDSDANVGRAERRSPVRILCNTADVQQRLAGHFDGNITLTHSRDLFSDIEAPYLANALIIDASAVPHEDFRELLGILRAQHAAGRYLPSLLITAPDRPVSARTSFMSGIAGRINSTAPEFLAKAADQLVNTTRLWRELEEKPFLKRKTDICLKSMRSDNHREFTLLESASDRLMPRGFNSFVSLLGRDVAFSGHDRTELAHLQSGNLFQTADALSIPRSHLVRKIADYTNFRLINRIIPETMTPGILPPEFCSRNLVLPVQLHADGYSLVFGNPFDWELVATLRQLRIAGDSRFLCTADPDAIRLALSSRQGRFAGALPRAGHTVDAARLDADIRHDVQKMCDYLLESAVRMRASDIHIEPKPSMTLVRFRIDGDLHDIICLDDIGHRIISRFKVCGNFDISEQRRPQDGSHDITILNRRYSLRMATSPTPDGESIAIRLLDTDAGLLSLMELGMNAEQERSVTNLAAHSNGMVLFVGPTGCGKTTSIYSMLSHIDCQKRSLVSVEDPVEYHIPFAIQHHVNQKAGVTFESLLKSSVRQDPDILFVGEIRDQASARIAMDFTSTGHLTYSSLHTVNAVSAIFRLERLGISRHVMAECLLAVVAQRLVKRVCPECKEIGPIHDDERCTMLRFVNDPPEFVARPKGCDFCGNTGYLGRTGVFEVIHITPRIADMLLANRSVAEIRHELKQQGEFLIAHHAIDKVKQLICSPADVISSVLYEELALETETPDHGCPAGTGTAAPPAATGVGHRLLLIDDDPLILDVLGTSLGSAGYICDTATDGVDALLKIGGNRYDAVISDIMMPNLDGFKLMELMNLKGISIPLIFMTAYDSPDYQQRARDLGAAEFIRKPLNLKTIAGTVNSLLRQET